MVQYKFKTITVVPTAMAFVDIALSKTQRKTATVIHARMKINTIRKFYMVKVKFCQSAFSDRLSKIINEFPHLDNIHPFYSDLINVLYDKDHYKLALGQLNTCRAIIDKIGKDYVKLLKYGDTLYRCKQLKKAALGRMATMMKKQKAALGYLEQVRQHLARLPSINPDERTVLLTGFPNVGKSSFINKITRANVEVQNYAFTTKSLYVGHMDYNYLRWQVIDSPGVLDRPLEDRNTIEMTAITALAHLHACVIFIIDLSPHCRYSIQDQTHLFRTLKPLYMKKPVLVVCNKTDLRKLSELSPEERNDIESLANEGGNISIMAMSNATEENIINVRNKACDLLLAHRIHIKTQTNKIAAVSHRLFRAMPEKRDKKDRTPFVPPSAVGGGNGMEVEKTTERDLEEENGGHGVYNIDLRKFWALKESEQNWDAIPEVWEGKNIADYVDSGILERLTELEAEEDEIQKAVAEATNGMEMDENDLSDGEELLFDEIEFQRWRKREGHKTAVARNHAVRPRKIHERSLGDMAEHLEDLGYDLKKFNSRAEKVRAEARKRNDETEERRGRTSKRDEESRMAEGPAEHMTRAQSRSKSRVTRPAPGMNSIKSTIKSRNLLHYTLKKLGKQGKQGTADRTIGTKMPKHLFTGKRGIGKTDWR